MLFWQLLGGREAPTINATIIGEGSARHPQRTFSIHPRTRPPGMASNQCPLGCRTLPENLKLVGAEGFEPPTYSV